VNPELGAGTPRNIEIEHRLEADQTRWRSARSGRDVEFARLQACDEIGRKPTSGRYASRDAGGEAFA